MNSLKVLFFGSTNDSILVLEQLKVESYEFSAIITQPARPSGRDHMITPTPVEIWTTKHNIPILSFATNPDKPWLYANEQQVIDTLQPFKPDILISACYGQKIPSSTIASATYGGLNIHPSLLPRWRGADPVPWAILTGDHQTGVTVVTLGDTFDEGKIIAQKKVPITDKDTSDELRTKLFTLGAQLLVNSLSDYISSKKSVPVISHSAPARPAGGFEIDHLPYARRLTRDDGFLPWELIDDAMNGNDVAHEKRPKQFSLGIGHWSLVIERALRAFSPWPGIWTEVKVKNTKFKVQSIENKRLKILSCHMTPDTSCLVLDSVQLEGKNPVSFKQFATVYL